MSTSDLRWHCSIKEDKVCFLRIYTYIVTVVSGHLQHASLHGIFVYKMLVENMSAALLFHIIVERKPP